MGISGELSGGMKCYMGGLHVDFNRVQLGITLIYTGGDGGGCLGGKVGFVYHLTSLRL